MQVRQTGTREVLLAGDMNTEVNAGSCVAGFIAGCAVTNCVAAAVPTRVLCRVGDPSDDELAAECAAAHRSPSVGGAQAEGSQCAATHT